MQVHAAVSEADVGRLAPGMTATFIVDAYPDRKFKGVIRQIRDAPQTLQNVVTYDAVIDVDNADLRLKPGMTANVTFVYAERKGVLRIPSAALRFRPPGGAAGGRGQGRRRRRRARRRSTRTQKAGGRRRRRRRRTDDADADVGARPRDEERLGAATATSCAEVPVEIGVVGRQQGRGARRRARRRRRAGHRRGRQERRRRQEQGPVLGARDGATAGRHGHQRAAHRRSPTSPRPTAWATSRWTRCAA